MRRGSAVFPGFAFLASSQDHGCENRKQYDARNDQEGNIAVNIDLKPLRVLAVVRVEEHFHADECEDEAEADFEVVEISDRAGEDEIEGAEAEDREDVRGEDQERVGGETEDRGDGIEGEDEVGGLDHQQDERERGE